MRALLRKKERSNRSSKVSRPEYDIDLNAQQLRYIWKSSSDILLVEIKNVSLMSIVSSYGL